MLQVPHAGNMLPDHVAHSSFPGYYGAVKLHSLLILWFNIIYFFLQG